MDLRSHDRSSLVRGPSRGWPIAMLWVVLLVAGCGSFRPTPLSEVPFMGVWEQWNRKPA